MRSLLVRVLLIKIAPLAELTSFWSGCAVAKIIKSCAAQLSPEALLPRWVSLLPVVVDAEEMLPTTNLLLELISG